MSIGALLKGSADTYMAARLVKRVVSDVVGKVPYSAIGVAALIGAALGVAFARRRGTAGKSAGSRPPGRLPKTAH